MRVTLGTGLIMLPKVKEIMVRDVRTVDVEETVLDAVHIMDRFEIGCVIATEDRKPVGILTERDILRRVVLRSNDPKKVNVREVMSKPLAKVGPNTNVKRAARMMIKRRIKKLVIVSSGRLVGILSLTDIVPLLELREAMGNVNPDEVPNRVKRVFNVYYDPIRQVRKRCPFTLISGTSISCIGSKCMWYVNERCVMTNILESNIDN